MSEWQKMGVIAPGGAVFQAVGPVAGTWWLGTEVGLVRETNAGWRPLSPQPIPGVSALAGAEGLLWTGNIAGALAYTNIGKDGAAWYRGRAHQVDATITAVLPSPAVAREGDVLAATDGAGIVRSTNQGRDWRVANFGLEDLHVVALASTPTLRQQEVVPARIHRWEAFAATTRGLYRTPNGGRAWLPAAEAPETAVQTLAVSPNFAEDRTVFAGTADQGLLRSTDGGRTWHTYNEGWPVLSYRRSTRCGCIPRLPHLPSAWPVPPMGGSSARRMGARTGLKSTRRKGPCSAWRAMSRACTLG